MKRDLTLSKIKNTNFIEFYESFIKNEPLNRKQYESLLAIAICFINADDVLVQQFGYRLIIKYCNQTNDYIPLYDIAINSGLYPISKFIEQHYITEEKRNFFTEWNDAFTEQFHNKNIYESEQQHNLAGFFTAHTRETLAIVAPTSYGKSELIISAIKEFSGRRICILTSSKALLMQTKKRIKQIAKDDFSKIILHPEMYNPNDHSCLAILTQERLMRLLKKDKDLAFDCIVIDEAHEMLENKTRGRILATAIIIAQKRNPDTVFKFLTPFISNPDNLKACFTSYEINAFKVNEYIKSENFFVYDLRNETGLHLYDQFLNTFISISSQKVDSYEEDIVKLYSADKNIVYLNKPSDIEKFALALADILPEVRSEEILTACENISNYLRPQYNLLTCLRKGIIYHHGSVPDAIRTYIENLYKNEPCIKYVITSSTLLSGVNLPAERMFILDNRRGKANLRPDSFKNLIGRVCRFNEIFNFESGTLKRLEPQIYIVFGNYFSKKANFKTFLPKVAKIEIKYQDDVDNVLLKATVIDPSNQKDFQQASEYIENYEEGIIKNYQYRYTSTEIGRICIINGITEIDIFSHEIIMQKSADGYKKKDIHISSASQMMDIIWELFLQYLPEKGAENLKRLDYPEARRFYAMLLDWRASNKSYTEMIGLFVKYWRQCLEKNRDTLIYVGKWGEIALPNGYTKCYTYLKDKNRTQIINLAIVRIKEEQDFLDNVLIKYVEALFDLGIVENRFYSKIKYGTDDKYAICLLKNGLSLSLALLLLEKYRNYLKIDIMENIVQFDDALINAMECAKENHILIFEVRDFL